MLAARSLAADSLAADMLAARSLAARSLAARSLAARSPAAVDGLAARRLAAAEEDQLHPQWRISQRPDGQRLRTRKKMELANLRTVLVVAPTSGQSWSLLGRELQS